MRAAPGAPRYSPGLLLVLTLTYQAEHAVANLDHDVLVLGLHVQAQKWLGIGGTQVEPPPGRAVPVTEGHAVELLDQHRAGGDVLGEGLPDPVLGGRDVLHVGVDLPRSEEHTSELRRFR